MHAALSKITDDYLLKQIITYHSIPSIRRESIKNIRNEIFLKKIAKSDTSKYIKLAAIDNIENNEILYEIITYLLDKVEWGREIDKEEEVIYKKILEKIRDTDLFNKLLVNYYFELRFLYKIKEIDDITNQYLLSFLVKVSFYDEIHYRALSKINQSLLLKEIIKSCTTVITNCHCHSNITLIANILDIKYDKTLQSILSSINIDFKSTKHTKEYVGAFGFAHVYSYDFSFDIIIDGSKRNFTYTGKRGAYREEFSQLYLAKSYFGLIDSDEILQYILKTVPLNEIITISKNTNNKLLKDYITKTY